MWRLAYENNTTQKVKNIGNSINESQLGGGDDNFNDFRLKEKGKDWGLQLVEGMLGWILISQMCQNPIRCLKSHYQRDK